MPRVSVRDVIYSSGKVAFGGGDKGTNLDLTGSEDIRVSVVVDKRAVESENIRVLDDDRRSEGIRVLDMDCKGVDEEMDSMVSEIKNVYGFPRGSDNEFVERNGATELLEAKVEGGRVSSAIEGGLDRKSSVQNGKIEHLGSTAGKGHLAVGKSNVSQYDSKLLMFDEFSENGSWGTVASKPLGCGYEIGDMVWGKVKSHPWWPGHIYSEAFATPSVRRSKREGHVLVAFFGDSSYGWFDPAELIPFDPNFAEKSQQTNSRTFTRAVEEAVDEASRRRGLGLVCRCRNPSNFRPTDVQGYFAVDVGDYERGSVYSANQIRKERDSFQSRETVAFVKQLAWTPTSDEHRGIHFIKNKAAILAYRKAVFEEFDETYAQAFGHQPVRPSPGPTQDVAQPVKGPSRAPLSGPLVIAEALGKGKSSAKPNKAKDQVKKERYLFKRRDEPVELKTHQTNQATSSAKPVYVEGSLAIATGDYVLQTRAPGSRKPQIPAKHEQIGTIAMDGVSGLSGNVNGKEAVNIEGKPAVSKFSMANSQMNTSKVESPASSLVDQAPGYHNLLEARSSPDMGKGAVLEMKESLGSGLVDDMPHTFETGMAMTNFKDDRLCSTASKLVEGFEQPLSRPTKVELHGREQVQDGCSDAHLLAAIDSKFNDGDSRMRTDCVVKKAKVLKRPVEELSTKKTFKKRRKELMSLSTEKSVPLGKKRKKELISSDSTVMCESAGKCGASAGKVTGKSVQVALAPREDFQVEYQKKNDQASSSLLPDSVGKQQIAGIGHMELELPQLLSDLRALALDPFHGVQRSPAVILQVFLRFRSLVYQKSLASMPPSENESNETCASKSTVFTVAYDNPPRENVRDLPSVKQVKPAARPDDLNKGGRKRGPSYRQEEMAATKKKKINDLKLLAAEKKAAQKIPEVLQGDGKERVAAIAKSVQPDSVKKTEHPNRSRSPDPTMLVMKFPPLGTLPSMSELKARFARFGPLDHSGTRVFWKTSTCRIVFWHKLDAEAALKFVVGCNNLFGNTNVRCHLRPLGAAVPESESGKVQREDTSMGTHKSVEQKSAAPLTPQSLQQPGVHVKSCLKKAAGDEVGSVTGGNGGGRGTTPRVKFMLGGEESSRREQLMIGNKNYNNANFADGGASSSSSLAMDFNSKNFQNVVRPPLSPILPLPTTQFPRMPNNLHYTQLAPRNSHNFNTPIAPQLPNAFNVDIAQQMLTLLTRCNDVVSDVIGMLGYVPYHPL